MKERSDRMSREAAEANTAEREARQDAAITPVHPLTSMARLSGAGTAEDNDPEAVMRRVEGSAQRTER
jgi:hypothetical protein